MSDKMRWCYGDTNPVVAAVDAATIIEIGDLLWQDADDAKPASELTQQMSDLDGPPIDQGAFAAREAFVKKFLGVAMQRSRSGDTAPIRVATTGVFEFDCVVDTFKLGDLIGAHNNPPPGKEEPTEGLENQCVMKCKTHSCAIGRVAKREAYATNSVLIDIRSTVMTGGVMGNSYAAG